MDEPRRHSPLRRITRRAWPWLLLVAALALWTLGRPGGPGLPEGEPAPSLVVPWTGDGGELDLEAQRGHVVVLAFWATWCPACRAEGPALSQLSERLGASGDTVVGVSVDEAPLEPVARAARRLGMTYPIAKATRADLDRFGVELLPTIYVIDPRGRIAEAFTGAVGADRLLEAVEAAR